MQISEVIKLQETLKQNREEASKPKTTMEISPLPSISAQDEQNKSKSELIEEVALIIFGVI